MTTGFSMTKALPNGTQLLDGPAALGLLLVLKLAEAGASTEAQSRTLARLIQRLQTVFKWTFVLLKKGLQARNVTAPEQAAKRSNVPRRDLKVQSWKLCGA